MDPQPKRRPDGFFDAVTISSNRVSLFSQVILNCCMPDSPSIKTRAAELGLDVCRITGADPARHAAFYQEWMAEGRAGEMAWLTRDPERRTDPRNVLAGARSIIVAGLNYWQPQPKGRGRIARYALGEDYHHVLLEKLETLTREITVGGASAKVYVDTGPVLEETAGRARGPWLAG